MEPHHHSKVMIIVGIFVAIIVIGLGLVIIRGKVFTPDSEQAPDTTMIEEQALIERATGEPTGPTIITDKDREAFIRRATGNN